MSHYQKKKNRKSFFYEFLHDRKKVLSYAVPLHLSSPGNRSVVKACNFEDANICTSFSPKVTDCPLTNKISKYKIYAY